MKDRFTEASAELPERNPYLYERSMATFGHQVISHIGDEPTHWHGRETNTRGADCILNCDPMPFGD